MGLVERLVPETSFEEWQQAIRLAQAHLHSLGITAIQDAAVVPGDARCLPSAGGTRRADRPGRGQPPLDAGQGRRAGGRSGRPQEQRHGRPAPNPRRKDLPGRCHGELHRCRPRALPGRERWLHRQQGDSGCTSRTSSPTWSPSSMLRAFRSTSTRSETVPSGSRSTPSRLPSTPTASATLDTTSRTSSSSIRTTSPASASWAWSRTHSLYGRPFRGYVQDPTLPFISEETGADDVPVRKPPPCGRNDCDGKRLDSLDRESAPTDSGRSEPRRSRGRRLGAVSPGRTPRASDRPRRLHDRLRLREPARARDGLDRGRQARRPRAPQPGPVRRGHERAWPAPWCSPWSRRAGLQRRESGWRGRPPAPTPPSAS